MNLTSTQKIKWQSLKKEIIKRPFLAYKIGLTNNEVESYFSGIFPTKEKIIEIDTLLNIEREKKIERLRPTLIKIVGNQGSVQFADKVGTDSMRIKYIIDKKTVTLSHDLISNIEIFLSYISDFEISIENLNDLKNYVPGRVDSLKIATLDISNKLNALTPYFEDLKNRDKKVNKQFAKSRPDDYRISYLQNNLNISITELERIRLEVDVIIGSLID